ncbi:fimbrial protein [Burkholderia sp. LMG 21824]|uniref:fimbrial protein n=1 Tax=Burkholderia sp. LMG 21824 TaxID=3158172 RepID=UPI003C2DC72F
MLYQTRLEYISAMSTRNTRFLRTAVLSLMLLVGVGVGEAQAVCTQSGGKITPVTFPQLPASLTLAPAAIGQVMAYYEVQAPLANPPSFLCAKGDILGLSNMTVSLPLQDQSKKIYESGLPGIGMRFSFKATVNWGLLTEPPYEGTTTGSGVLIYPFDIMRVEFIRTAMDVGGGSITPFDLSTSFYIGTNPRTTIPITGTQMKTTLVNKIYFSSCYNQSSAPTVNLGRPSISELKQGATLQKDFSLDIRCDGMNSTTKPPVTIYFKGNSPRDGLLLTDGQGEAGRAQGVGVALTNSNGVALPFSKAKAMPMSWTSSGTNTEFYHFSGKARYVVSGGEVKAGKADATLTYVLEYN